MRFTKMHGAGNDYIYVNAFVETVPDAPTQARRMADRHTGVGSDGLILIAPSDGAHVRMEMYNADGSRGRMCGNGLRCVVKYAHDHGLAPRPDRPDKSVVESASRGLLQHVAGAGQVSEPILVETDAGILAAVVCIEGPLAGQVCADVGVPALDPAAIPTTLPADRVIDAPLDVEGQSLRVTCVSTGSAHVVIFVDDLETVDLHRMGPCLERHPAFPDRINAHFVQVISPHEARVVHWERGSGPTRACGTGACSVCVAGVLTGRLDRAVTVRMPGGCLDIDWGADGHLYMTGPAIEVFSGDWPEVVST
jgi:diaminopimelate epimerase